MKPVTAFLAASLLGNATLAALYLSRPAAPAPSGRVAPATTAVPNPRPPVSGDALRQALAAGDLAALEAAGLSPQAARELLLGRTFFRAFERIRAARANQPADERWWRSSRIASPASRELQLQIRREVSDALAAAFGDDLGLFSSSDPAQQFNFLSPEKRDALRRITQDYDEMMAKFSAGGLQLPSDRERLKLLRAERDRDIAALLTPAEREAYELRTSTSAQVLRARYGDGIESEEDFRKLYALQKAFDDRYPLDALSGKVTPEQMRARGEAQRQLQEGIRAALGEDKYTALRRASDPDLRTVDALVSRLDLPPGTTARIATSRESFAAESQRINANTGLNPQQRRTQLQELGARAKAELTQALGAEAADAYAQRSPWVSMLQNGMAYTTTPPANAPGLALGGMPGVHPVPPAGAGGPGGERQMFTIAAPVTAGELIGVDPANGANGTRVMTFNTVEANVNAPAAGQRVIVAPKPPAPNEPRPSP